MPEIRPITEADAGAFLDLCQRLDEETAFMMLEPGERKTTPDEQRARIAGILASPNSMIFVAEHEGQLVGYLAAMGGAYRRNRHNAHLVIGIRRAFTGQGLGTRLFQALEAWAPGAGLHRLELTVMVHNAAGLALYRKMGFQVEGTRVHSLRVDGRWVDEVSMAKLLD